MGKKNNFSNNPLMLMLTLVFILSLIGYFVRWILFHCVFLDSKYPDRTACWNSQVSESINQSVNDMQESFRKSLEKQQAERDNQTKQNLTNTGNTNTWNIIR